MNIIITFFKKLGLSLILIAIALQIVLFNNHAIAAEPIDSNRAAQQAERAADKITKEDAIKERYNKTGSGDELIQKARETAQKKLNSLADKSQNETNANELTSQEENFLENLQGKTNE